MSRQFLYLSLACLACSCGGSPSIPTPGSAPALAPQPGPSAGTTQLSGIVYDSAFQPIGAARVEVLNGPQAGTWVLTDAQGRYGLAGAFDDATEFRATKAGLLAATATRGPRCAQCNPNWWVYFYLRPEGASIDLAGDYTLTIAADPACTGFPAELREKTYAATITPATRPSHPADTTFDLTITDAPFLANYRTVDVFVSRNFMMFAPGDLHGAPGLVERLGATTYLTFGGSITATVTSPSQITASFDGFIEQCELAEEWGGRRNCTSGPTVSRAACASVHHQVTLARR